VTGHHNSFSIDKLQEPLNTRPSIGYGLLERDTVGGDYRYQLVP
jgi:hypothetical protein